MRAFLERFLPRAERRAALWLVVGGTAVMWMARRLGNLVFDQMMVVRDAPPVPLDAALLVQALSAFALVAILVALLIRLGHAPKTLALYLFLVGLFDAVIGLVFVPLDYLQLASFGARLTSAHFSASLVAFAIGLGALAGAWIAVTVTMARIRDAGFSGDDSEEGEGLKRKPSSDGLTFIGWSGRPMRGDARLAVALVFVGVIPNAAFAAYGSGTAVLSRYLEDGASFTTIAVGGLLLAAVTWFFSARAVVLRAGVVSAWLVALAPIVPLVIRGFGPISQLGDSEVLRGLVVTAIWNVVAVAAALLGTASALRAKPATLSSPDQQDPGASAPDDTAGGN